ncbi:MAG TPA: hypothetical protein VMT38_09295 [Terracidiphilus sp.]|nr:hypothetical protein [Terracidiphilus sp.]
MRLNLRVLHGSSSGRAIVVLAMAGALVWPMRGISQAESNTNIPPGQATGAQNGAKGAEIAAAGDGPVANPGRPTVSTPATLTPPGYLQFESGILAAWHSPEFASQASLNEVIKFAISRRIELLAASNPFVHSNTQPANGDGGVSLGVQAVLWPGEGARPTISTSYFHEVQNGGTPDLDMGSATNSTILLFSADVKGFHYDTNYLFNEVDSDDGVRRSQFAQTLSISHGVGKRFGVSGELWDFTQPFLRSHAFGNLWAADFNAKKNLVFDVAFDRGLTSTSTKWEILAGFTYLLPRRIHLR